MKRINSFVCFLFIAFIYFSLILSCHKGMTKIHYSKNINKCIENLENLEQWLHRDYEDGRIPYDIAETYAIVIVNTKYGLIKRQKKLNKEIDETDEF